MRTLNQLKANLKPGCYLYKTRGRVTGESIFVKQGGETVCYKCGTVKSFIEECIKRGLVKEA